MTKAGECSAKCGIGIKKVLEFCTFSYDKGLDCSNSRTESVDCNLQECKPIQKYKYGPWSDWTDCDKPCRKGLNDQSIQTRTRECDPSDCPDELKIGMKKF